MIFKILAIIVVLVLVYMVFFKKNREQDIAKKEDLDQITDTLIECPSCGTFFSKDEGVLSNGKYYCSKGCLK